MNSNSLVYILDDILEYCLKKVKYDEQVKEKVELYNKAKAEFLKDSNFNKIITKELALTKLKLRLLQKRSSNVSTEYKLLINDLIMDLETHINTIRKKR